MINNVSINLLHSMNKIFIQQIKLLQIFDLTYKPLLSFWKTKNIWIPYWHEFNTKDGFNVVKPYSFDEYITLLASKRKLIFVNINCFTFILWIT
jgi:hypothetical protein